MLSDSFQAQVDADPNPECSELFWNLVALETDGQVSPF